MRGRGSFVGCMKQVEINDRKIELIDDALGGLNIEDCSDPCLENSSTIHRNDSMKSSDNEDREISSNGKSKYAFDVVDDTNVHSERIVRVSLQKPKVREFGACFEGNDSRKIIRRTENSQNSVNIRFRTHSPDGLLFYVASEFIDGSESFFLLSIEHGFMHFRYNFGSTIFDNKCVDMKVDDGLWHRVRATR